MSTSNTEIITICVSEYLSADLVKKIAAALWGSAELSDGVKSSLYHFKTETDYFNVVAQNKSGDFVSRLSCIQNDSNHKLWYYGDLFVIPKYRCRQLNLRLFYVLARFLPLLKPPRHPQSHRQNQA